MDTLKQAAITFSKIKEIEYHIVVSSGRNKPLEKIIINFCDEDLSILSENTPSSLRRG